MIAESSQYHLKSNRDGYKKLLLILLSVFHYGICHFQEQYYAMSKKLCNRGILSRLDSNVKWKSVNYFSFQFEDHWIWKFSNNIDFRKLNFLSEEKISECSRFVNFFSVWSAYLLTMAGRGKNSLKYVWKKILLHN